MVKLQNPNNGGARFPEPEEDRDHHPVPPLALTNGGSISTDDDPQRFSEDFDSTCSTPYVSAPSSPGRGGSSAGYFYSAPASPMHFVLSSAPASSAAYSYSSETISSSEFEFSSRFSPNGSSAAGSMSSADELFLNGQIRPVKLSSHLQRPQILSPLIDLDAEEDDESEIITSLNRGRDLKLRSRSLHRKARSLSPLRKAEIQWLEEEEEEEDCTGPKPKDSSEKHILDLQSEVISTETTPSCSTSSSRSSSTGRNSKKWIFLKDLLYRSKSEGRGNGKEKFWSSISFSPSKYKDNLSQDQDSSLQNQDQKHSNLKKNKKQCKQSGSAKKGGVSGRPTNGVAKRRVPPSPHELHYTANRAQAEEMKKKTFLPYRQGLLGCLGFSSKGYGALNGLTRALNPVSSR